MNGTLAHPDPGQPAPRVPLGERFNLRMIGFIAIIAILVGYPIYIMVEQQVSGGIRNAAGGYKDVNLKAMSTFTFDQVSGKLGDIPERWRALDGQKVILRGEMWEPTAAAQTVDSFALVYSIADCCVTSTPQVQHFIHATVPPGKTVHYYDGPVEVRGVLRVNVRSEMGRVASVYQLDVESVKPSAG